MAERQTKRKRAERREVARLIIAGDPDISGEALMKEMRRREVPVSRSYAYALCDELRDEAAAEESDAARREARRPHARLLERELCRYQVPHGVAIVLALALDAARWSGDPSTETVPVGVTPPPEGEDHDRRAAFRETFLRFLDAIVDGSATDGGDARCEIRLPLFVEREELPTLLRRLAYPLVGAAAQEPAQEEGWRDGSDEVIEPQQPATGEDF